MRLKHTLPFFLLLAFSCGPDTETNNGTTNNGTTSNNGATTNNGATSNNGMTNEEMVVRSTITIDEADVSITATAMNQDGTEVAIATKNLITFEERVRIFSSADGSELREMSDFSLPDDPAEGNITTVENLFWSGSDKLTALQSYRHRFTWNAQTGELLEKKASSEVTDKCAGPRGGVFHPNFNETFVATQAFPADNTICKINFDTYEAEVFTLAEGEVVQSFVLDSTGEKLWISFSDPTDANGLSQDIVNTVAYNARTMAPLADPLNPEGELVLVGDGFFVEQNGGTTSLVPGGDFAAQSDTLAAPGGEVLVTPLNSKDTRFIAMPSGSLIGTIAKDNRYLRSFSGNAEVATTVDNVNSEISILEIGTRTSTLVFVEPEVPSGTLSGTVTIDGTEEAVSGNCELLTNADLGATQFLAIGTTASGWSIDARSQNLLKNSRYVFTNADDSYINTTAIAQNLMIDGPTSTSTGTAVEGAGTLFAFERFELFERVVDAGHPSGFKAIDFVFNGVCTP